MSSPWEILANLKMPPYSAHDYRKGVKPDAMTLYPYFLLGIYTAHEVEILKARIAELEAQNEKDTL